MTNPNLQPKQINYCSFCNKHRDQVAKLIVGENVGICNDCVDFCTTLLSDPAEAPIDSTLTDILDPRKLKEFLDQYVIGQDQAKIMLSVAIVNHYKRINCQDHNIRLDKANILMLGPTGSGKTLLAKTVAKYLDVPFAIADATSLTEAGYVGDDVESCVNRLLSAADGDVEKTQKGIIFIDEIDKIARKSESASITRDVSGEGVQQALLKLVEGTICTVPMTAGRKHPKGEMVEIDTSNILFIAGGAFVGIDNIIKNRTNGTSIGFAADVDPLVIIDKKDVVPEDIIRYGMIPEFVGRFPNWVNLEPLNKQALVDILTKVKNNYLEQYQWLFRQDQIELEFDSQAIDIIADNTLKNKTGARGLLSEVERVLIPHMYNIVDYRNRGIKTLTIDQNLVNNPSTLED
jgi:ATP-dependent Clp protease ATP-binding subunit ClpX